jgi:hypothetical protein
MLFGKTLSATKLALDACEHVHVKFYGAIPKSNYPVNFMRNRAIDGVSTSHYLMLDADFLPSSNLRSALQDQADIYLANDTAALVVPAFELDVTSNRLRAQLGESHQVQTNVKIVRILGCLLRSLWAPMEMPRSP